VNDNLDPVLFALIRVYSPATHFSDQDFFLLVAAVSAHRLNARTPGSLGPPGVVAMFLAAVTAA
jgi:hypothetical protein